MIATRVIPCLLLRNGGLVKTTKFKNEKYVGDPRNAVKIFNEKEVDELIILDILATPENKKPNFELITEIVSEAFMPVGYGGGIHSIEDARRLFTLGVEKVVICTHAVEDPDFITTASDEFGSQSVVVCIDVRKNFWGKYEVYINGGRKSTGLDPVNFGILMAKKGAGELIINSIDRDGTQQGYDLGLIKQVASAVTIPVIASGGAASLEDFSSAVKDAGASAVTAGSMFVFHGKHRAVLISYPTQTDLRRIF